MAGLPPDPKGWSVEQVKQWAVAEVGIDAEDADQLVKQKIGGRALHTLTKLDLERWGIPGGPAGLLMEAIEGLGGGGGSSSVAAPEHVSKRARMDAVILQEGDGVELESVLWSAEDPYVKTQQLALSGLGKEDRLLYLREEAQDLWEFMDGVVSGELQTTGGETACVGLIIGPPGTGKSTLAWAWACEQAASRARRVLWLHFRGGRRAVVAADGRVRRCDFSSLRMMEPGVLDSAVLDDVDTLIIDGITKANYDEWSEALCLWRARDDTNSRRAFLVTSAQLVVAGEQLEAAATAEIRMPSWSLEQYVAACSEGKFIDAVRERLGVGDSDQEKIADKFVLAGGSARWMFGMNVDAATSDIVKQLGKVKNFADLLKGSGGGASADAVNHLQCWSRDGRRPTVISEFAMRWLSQEVGLEFVNMCYAHEAVQNNPAWSGWVFELEFLTRLRLAVESGASIELVESKAGGEEEKIEWRAPHRQTFKELGAVTQLATDGRLAGGCWLVPEKWNQGGYDAAFVEGTTLRAVQVTRAKVHGFKLDYVVSLVKAVVAGGLQVETVEVYLVARGADEARVGDVRGDLRIWQFDNKPSSIHIVRLREANTSA